MSHQNAPDRRQFFERFRLRLSGPDERANANRRLRIDHLPSDDPAIVRRVVVDWHADVAPSWEDGALVVFTQAGAMFRWDLSVAEIAFLRPIDGQHSIGSLHDAAVEAPATADTFAARVTLLTRLLDAGVLRIVRDEPARAGGR